MKPYINFNLFLIYIEYNDGITYDSLSKLPWGFISLDKARYEIITTTNSITEEIVKTVIDKPKLKSFNTFIEGIFQYKNDYWYKNYKHKISIMKTARESFYSLMDSLELDRNNKNYLLIEKL
jgi:hypothetical protein